MIGSRHVAGYLSLPRADLRREAPLIVHESEPQEIATLLRAARIIAVVGLSADPARPSHEVARSLQQLRLSHHSRHSELRQLSSARPPCPTSIIWRTCSARASRVDIVDVFRRPEHVAQRRGRLHTAPAFRRCGCRTASWMSRPRRGRCAPESSPSWIVVCSDRRTRAEPCSRRAAIRAWPFRLSCRRCASSSRRCTASGNDFIVFDAPAGLACPTPEQLRAARRPAYRHRLRPGAGAGAAASRRTPRSSIASSTPTASRSSNAATARAASQRSCTAAGARIAGAVHDGQSGRARPGAHRRAPSVVSVDMGVPISIRAALPFDAAQRGATPIRSRSPARRSRSARCRWAIRMRC